MTTSPRFFTDPKSGSSYVLGSRLSASDMNQILAGMRAIDLALERSNVENWPDLYSATRAQDRAVCWSPYAQKWIVGYQNAANPEVQRGSKIVGMSAASSQPAAEEGLTIKSLAAHPTLGTVIMCGDPGASSNHKYRYSDDGGDTWSSGHSTVTSTTSVNAVCYHSATGIDFVTGAEGGVIETTITGGTWTARTAANANDISALASSGTLVVGVSSTSTNKCVKSANGTAWSESTLPVTASWYGVCYLSNQGYWLVAGITAGNELVMCKSSDGVTWSQVTITGIATANGVIAARSLVSTGNIAVFIEDVAAGDVIASEDIGSTWRIVRRGIGTTGSSLGNGVLLAAATRDSRVCQLFSSWENAGDIVRYASSIA